MKLNIQPGVMTNHGLRSKIIFATQPEKEDQLT
jgi:hypothetical protein